MLWNWLGRFIELENNNETADHWTPPTKSDPPMSVWERLNTIVLRRRISFTVDVSKKVLRVAEIDIIVFQVQTKYSV